VVRLIVGLGLIGLPSWFLMPRLWTVTSSQGVVNGHVYIMNAPVEGIVAAAPPAIMQPVAAGTPLVRIDASSVDRGRLGELEAEAATLTERVAALKDRIRDEESLKQELEASYRNYQTSMIQRISHELEEARLAAMAATVTSEQRAYEEDQERTLSRRGFSSSRELSQACSATAIAQAQAAQANAAAERLAGQLEAIKGGTFTGPGDSRNDVPYSRQRIHEIDMQRLRDESEIREQVVRIAELRRQIRDEDARIRQRSGFQLVAPFDALVWRRSVAAGSPVAVQAELLRLVDRSTQFVDAIVRAKHGDDIRPGDRVIIRPVGSAGVVAGRVRSVLGERTSDPSVAVDVPRAE
jgi:multidrug resistance efflux pump